MKKPLEKNNWRIHLKLHRVLLRKKTLNRYKRITLRQIHFHLKIIHLKILKIKIKTILSIKTLNIQIFQIVKMMKNKNLQLLHQMSLIKNIKNKLMYKYQQIHLRKKNSHNLIQMQIMYSMKIIWEIQL